jgi:hypothetical protein
MPLFENVLLAVLGSAIVSPVGAPARTFTA